jgi:hypothetical protein
MIVTMYLGANPMERDYFITALFWMYFFVSKEDLAKLQENYNRKKTKAVDPERPALLLS